MRVNWWALAGMIVVLSLLAACAPAAPTPAPVPPAAATAKPPAAAAATTAPVAAPTAQPAASIKRGGKLVDAVNDEWSPSIHPHRLMSDDATIVEVTEPFLEYALVDYQKATWELRPLLVETWDQSDPKVVILKLRKGVKFHDGSDWNAEVAKWNLDMMVKDTKSAMRAEFDPIVDNVQVVDDLTVRVNLKGPSPVFLKDLGHGAVKVHALSKKYADQNGYDAYDRTLVGTGPMKFDKWLSGQGMWVKRWENYYQMGEDGKPLPYLDEIQTRWVQDPSVKVLEFRTGNIDVIDRMDPKDIPALRNEQSVVTYEQTWSAKTQYVFMNMDPNSPKKSPWHGPYPGNVKLRQAVYHAIDKETLAKTIAPGAGAAVYLFWAPGEVGYNANIPKYDYQPEKTKQLLAESGFPNGIDMELTSMSRQPDARVGEVMKSMFDKLNIRTSLTTAERTAFENIARNGNYQYGLSGGSIGRLDPNSAAFRYKRGATKQYAQAGSEEMDKCFDEAAITMDEKARGQIYEKCQRLIYEEAAYDHIMSFPFVIGHNKKVKGVTPHFAPYFRHIRTWIDK